MELVLLLFMFGMFLSFYVAGALDIARVVSRDEHIRWRSVKVALLCTVVLWPLTLVLWSLLKARGLMSAADRRSE